MALVAENLKTIFNKIQSSAKRVGRLGNDITLVAVSKFQDPLMILDGYQAGHRDFGENYAQELRDKSKVLKGDIHWHFIGPLQENKVKYVVGTATLIHAIENEKILKAIDQRAAKLGIIQDVLIEVNIGKDPAKHGIMPEEVEDFLGLFTQTPNVKCLGFMTIPPIENNIQKTRAYFSNMRNILYSLKKLTLPSNVILKHLSMGMTNDFEIAIEEGATIVRIGTAIFGQRPKKRPVIDTSKILVT